MRKLRHEDGAVHISSLKRFSLSALHYKSTVENGYGETTRGMRIGTVTHHCVLGPKQRRPAVRFGGDTRRGAEWARFAAENAHCDIITAPEWDEGEAIANAVMTDPIAWPLIRHAQKEVPFKWRMGEIECATDGVDIVGEGYIADLKVTSCTQPESWQRHASKLLYHAQMAFYAHGARANGISPKSLYIIGVEARPPYAVTVLRLSKATIECGEKCVASWLEQLQACESADQWPGYTQAIVDYDVPVWLGGAEEESEDEG